MPLEYRRRQLLQVARLLEENSASLEAALYEDLRKPRIEIGQGETQFAIASALRVVDSLEEWAKPEKPHITEEWRSGWDATIYKTPKGPSLIVTYVPPYFDEFSPCSIVSMFFELDLGTSPLRYASTRLLVLLLRDVRVWSRCRNSRQRFPVSSASCSPSI